MGRLKAESYGCVVCITRDANKTPSRLINTDSHMTGDHQHTPAPFPISGPVSIDIREFGVRLRI